MRRKLSTYILNGHKFKVKSKYLDLSIKHLNWNETRNLKYSSTLEKKILEIKIYLKSITILFLSMMNLEFIKNPISIVRK